MIKLTNLTNKVRLLLAALTIAVSMSGLGAQADAFTPTLQACKGKSNVPTSAHGLVRTTNIWIDLGGGLFAPVPYTAKGLNVGQIVVQRAPDACATTEQQTVYVNYRVSGFVNQKPWQLLVSKWLSVQLDSGRQGIFAPLELFPATVVSNLHLDVDIQWYTTSGKYLGRIWLNYGTSGDYQCPTGVTCFLGTDPTYGAFIGL